MHRAGTAEQAQQRRHSRARRALSACRPSEDNRGGREEQTDEPAEAVYHGLRFKIPLPVGMVRSRGQQAGTEALGAALQDAKSLVPIGVRELDELWGMPYMPHMPYTHAPSPLVHRTLSCCAAHLHSRTTAFAPARGLSGTGKAFPPRGTHAGRATGRRPP